MSNNLSLRCAIYARVSTDDQDCSMQVTELREYAARRGWEAIGEYVDTGWSGGKASRPQLDKLMHECRTTKNIECVLVWKLDRWGRSVSHCLSSVEELSRLHVRWIATTQHIDTDESSPMNRFVMVMLAAVAQFEREIGRERTMAGLANARRKHVQFGRRRKIFDREKAKALRRAGSSQREIARALGVSKTVVQRMFAG